MLPLFFKTARRLSNKTSAYFRHIEGKFHINSQTEKDQKIWDREPEPATLAGLALFIGFTSRKELEDYEQNGDFGYVIRRCRLKIEAAYEKKLHQQASSGAVFALKNMGWNDKADESKTSNIITSLKIEVIETGPKLAANEKEVML